MERVKDDKNNISEATVDEKQRFLPETAACYDVQVVDKDASFEDSGFADREGEGLQGHGNAGQ